MVQSVQWFTLVYLPCVNKLTGLLVFSLPMNPWCETDPRKTIAGFMAPVYIHICHPQAQGCSAVAFCIFLTLFKGGEGSSETHVQKNVDNL